jgi:hypothetical protein
MKSIPISWATNAVPQIKEHKIAQDNENIFLFILNGQFSSKIFA